MNRIALVEDHERMASLIGKAFAAIGVEVETFGRIASARSAVAQIAYATLVVDRGLPDGDGLDFVRELRAAGNLTPCLVLTARDALHDRIEGLETGADDYLVKPFAMDELVARVKALLRRPAVLRSLAPSLGDLQVLPEQRAMKCGDDTVSLAPAELQMMLSLVRAGGDTVRRSALESAGWGLADAVTPNAFDVALHRIRRKLGAIDSRLRIVNLRGQGYALKDALEEMPGAP